MPSFIVKQPSGRYGRFSTIPDGFTHLNMTREEALELCRIEMGVLESVAKVDRADAEDICAAGKDPDGPPPRAPLHRWRACLHTMRVLNKHTDAAEAEATDAEE